MKYLLLVLIPLFLLKAARAQNELPLNFKSVIDISLTDMGKPRFYYGIKPESEARPFQDIQFRTFGIVYQVDYTASIVSVPQPDIFLGFCGFELKGVEKIDLTWCKPADN